MNFETILNILKGIDWKPIICKLYKDYGRNFLKGYVLSTENTFDDAAFLAADKLIVCTICGQCDDYVAPIVSE